MSMFDCTPYTPISKLGPYRAADYFALPVGSRVELLRGWLVPIEVPLFYHSASFDTAHLATKEVLSELIAAVRRQRSIDGLVGLNRHQLVIEVRAAQQRRITRIDQLRRYALLGVEEYWFIDPIERYILFYVLKVGQYVVHTGIDNRYQSPRLPEVEIDLANFWKEVAERLPAN